MSENKQEKTFESILDQYYTSPLPREGFAIGLEQKLFTQKGRPGRLRWGMIWNNWRPAAIIMTLSILVAMFLTGPLQVQAAIEKLLHYIPGFGLIDQSSSIRSLAHPISQTRNGVTVTVKQAILSSEKTGLVFTVNGVLPHMIAGDTLDAQKMACWASPRLLLPDGSQLLANETGSFGYDADQNYQAMIFYPPLAPDINRISFLLPCIQGTLPGKAPENWELAIQLEKVQPQVTLTPLTTVNETHNASLETLSQIAPSLKLDKVIETEIGYIFVGDFQSVYPNSRVAEDNKSYVPTIIDAADNQLPYTIATDLLTSSADQGKFHWAYQITTKEITWPVTIEFSTVGITCFDHPTEFQLATGVAPEAGKVWDIHKELRVGTCALKILSAKRNQNGYTFLVAGLSDPIRDLRLDIAGAPAFKISRRDFPSYLEYKLVYDEQSPTGDLDIVVSDVTLNLSGPWTISWQPENKTEYGSTPTPESAK